MSEAVVLGFVSEHIKTSESKVVVLRAKGAACLASDTSGTAVIFFVSFGDIVVLVPLLEVDLIAAAKRELEELERADVVLNMSALK